MIIIKINEEGYLEISKRNYNDINSESFEDRKWYNSDFEVIKSNIEKSNNLYLFIGEERNYFKKYVDHWVSKDKYVYEQSYYNENFIISDYFIQYFRDATDVSDEVNIKVDEINIDEGYIIIKSNKYINSGSIMSHLYDIDCKFKLELNEEKNSLKITVSDFEIFDDFKELVLFRKSFLDKK